MDKNKKKTIMTAATGMAAGAAGSQGVEVAIDWYKKENDPKPTPNPNDTSVVVHQEESNPAPSPTSSQTPAPQPNPSGTEYSGITEVVPVDTGGTQAEVVIDVPQPVVIPGVDDVDPNVIAVTILTEPEEIIDDDVLLAETHELGVSEEPEGAGSVEGVAEEEENEILAEAEEEEEESLEIDTI